MFKKINSGTFRAYGKPIVNIYINGIKMEDWLQFRIEKSGCGDIDSFMVQFPWDISDTPRNKILYSGSNDASAIVKGRATVRIDCGFEKETLKTLIEGDVDYPIWNFSNGEYISLFGRSYASRAYDYRETIKYQNFTATEAHKKICAFHGLTPIVPIETQDFIGAYQNNDHQTLPEEISHWDYILYLAEQEGFVSRVWDTKWYFGPLTSLKEYQKEPLPFSYGHNIKNLRLERAPNAARNFQIEVISWNSGDKKSKGLRVVERAQVGELDGKNPYTIRRFVPNLTIEKAQKHAHNIAYALSSQQFSGTFETDYFADIMCDRKIVLYGVGKGLSEIYHITKLEIYGSPNEGLQCGISFSNIPPTN